MTSYRPTDRLVCSCCMRVYDKDPFGSLLPYYDGFDESCTCGGDIENGYECELCGSVTPESEVLEDGDRVYCPECRSECAYCYSIVPTASICKSDEGYPCCPECKKAESDAA